MSLNVRVLPINEAAATVAVAVKNGHATVATVSVLPHDIEIEQALLGAMLVDQRCIEKINEFLEQHHFYMPLHQRLYEYILKLNSNGIVPTPNLLKGFF